MKVRLAAVACVLAGCAPAPTTVRVDIDAAAGVTVTALTLHVSLGGVDHAEALPASSLPGRAVVKLPDVAADVALTLDGESAAGDALSASATVHTVPHKAVETMLVLGGALSGGDLGPSSGDMTCLGGARCAWLFRRRVTIAATTALPAGYAVRVPLDAQLFPSTKTNADLSDVRVFGDPPDGEHARVIDVAPPGQTRALWFRLPGALAAGASDATFAVYYGNPNAGAPPADPTQVFALYDGFDGLAPSGFWLTSGAPTVAGGNVTLHMNGSDGLTTTAATDGVPTLSAVEWAARVTNPASAGQVTTNGTFWFWTGYQHTGDFTPSDPWIVFIQRAANEVHGEQKIATSPTCASGNGCTGPSLGLDNTFHWYRIERSPTATRFYFDGTLAYTVNDSNDTDYSLMLRNFAVSSDLLVDWLRARPLATPEPTVTVGDEEIVQ